MPFTLVIDVGQTMPSLANSIGRKKLVRYLTNKRIKDVNHTQINHKLILRINKVCLFRIQCIQNFQNITMRPWCSDNWIFYIPVKNKKSKKYIIFEIFNLNTFVNIVVVTALDVIICNAFGYLYLEIYI